MRGHRPHHPRHPVVCLSRLPPLRLHVHPGDGPPMLALEGHITLPHDVGALGLGRVLPITPHACAEESAPEEVRAPGGGPGQHQLVVKAYVVVDPPPHGLKHGQCVADEGRRGHQVLVLLPDATHFSLPTVLKCLTLARLVLTHRNSGGEDPKMKQVGSRRPLYLQYFLNKWHTARIISNAITLLQYDGR